jgi:hypothetical protein
MKNNSKIIVITGHYGAGKTNLAINLALTLKKSSFSDNGHAVAAGSAESLSGGLSVTVADLDIVNPYFRTSDYRKLLQDAGIRLAASKYAGSSLDIPSISLDIRGEADKSDFLIMDVGGDPEGARALGRYTSVLNELGYEMYYVINCYRNSTGEAKQAVDVMRKIESILEPSGGLKCTAIVNNSNLGRETTAEIVDESVPFAEEVSMITGLPLLEIPVKVYVKPAWEL